MNVLSVTSIADFKSANNIQSLDVYQSTTGKLFVRIGAQRIGVAAGTDLRGPLVVIEMENNGESWSFIAQETTPPAKKVATI